MRRNKWDFITGEKPIAEIYAVIRCQGYHEPAQLSGPPENCHPEEGEDERIIERLDLDDDMGAFTEIEHEGEWGFFIPESRLSELIYKYDLDDLY